MTRLWLRSESRPDEHRTPIVPDDARTLVELGVELTVEATDQRCFATRDYRAAGCTIAPAGSWVDAGDDDFVVGLKELPPAPAALTQRHVFFGHAYKGQRDGRELLRRFVTGGGALLDLESLVDDDGRRLAAFGFWAGYVGAALAILHARGRLPTPLRPQSRAALDAELGSSSAVDASRVLVVGALGRSGRGACAALESAAVEPTCWDLAETRSRDREALLAHDVLVNAVFTSCPVAPFVEGADAADPARRLSIIADVTCDVGSDRNALPIYDHPTSWGEPARRLHDGPPPLDVIAIDNLPSLLPRESSVDFSAQLTPQLARLGDDSPAWRRCLVAFRDASASLAREPARA